MARHQEKGLMYFPFDVKFFKDRKIRRLYSNYGSDGIVIYLYLLCIIYDEGYFLKVDEYLNEDIAFELNMSEEKIGQVINFLCKRSLLDSTLFTSDKVLTSNGIQARFQEAVKTRATKTAIEVDQKYWLFGENETKGYIKVTQNSDSSEKKSNSSEKNNDSSEKKDTNKSKVNKSKVNKSKEESVRKHPHGEYSNVFLSDEEINRLQESTPNYLKLINSLSSYMASTGKIYKNHYATIKRWAENEKQSKALESDPADQLARKIQFQQLQKWRLEKNEQ